MSDMAENNRKLQDDEHRHRDQKVHLLRQRRGVPYEIERVVCASCGRVLLDRPVRRAAA